MPFKDKQKKDEYSRKYYQEHKSNKEYILKREKLKEKFIKENPNYMKEYNKKYREKNKEYFKKYGKKWREQNEKEVREYHKEYNKKWRKDHKEHIQEYRKRLGVRIKERECNKKYYEKNKKNKKNCIDCGKKIYRGSLRCYSCAKKGKLSPNWQGGTSFEPYGLEFNKELKEQIRTRDNFACQECEKPQKELKRKLDVHHIDYNKQNNSIFNLISLCLKCHMKTNSNRKHWTNYFKMKIFIMEFFNPQNIKIFKNKRLIGMERIRRK